MKHKYISMNKNSHPRLPPDDLKENIKCLIVYRFYRESNVLIFSFADNDVEAAIAQSKALVMSSSRQQLQHPHLQMLQNQQQSQSSSISSCASAQTIMLHASTTTMQTSTTTTVSRNSSLLQPNAMVSSTYSGTSGHEMLNIADVADLLHPQHAIITGKLKVCLY